MGDSRSLSREIGRLVMVDRESLTYKCVALKFGVSMDEAKAELQNFIDKGHGKDEASFARAMYLIAGIPKEADSLPTDSGEEKTTSSLEGDKNHSRIFFPSHCVKIVFQEDIETARALMKTVTSFHVFSVSPVEISDPEILSNALHSANRASVKTNLDSNDNQTIDWCLRNSLSAIRNDCGSIESSSKNIVRPTGMIKTEGSAPSKVPALQKKPQSIVNAFKTNPNPKKPTTSKKSNIRKSLNEAKGNIESVESAVVSDVAIESKRSKTADIALEKNIIKESLAYADDDRPTQSQRRARKTINVIDDNDDSDDSSNEVELQEISNENDTRKKQLEELEAERIAEKGRLKEERKLKKRQEKEEQKQILIEENRKRALKALNVVAAQVNGEANENLKNSARPVKRMKKIVKEVKDEEGYLVTEETWVEEEVDSNIVIEPAHEKMSQKAVVQEKTKPVEKKAIEAPIKTLPLGQKKKLRGAQTQKLSAFFAKKQ